MLKIKNVGKFKTDLKKFSNKQNIINELDKIIKLLISHQPLEAKHRDHNLTGSWLSHRECHVKPDVLLIYKTNETTLFLERIGSHSELF